MVACDGVGFTVVEAGVGVDVEAEMEFVVVGAKEGSGMLAEGVVVLTVKQTEVRSTAKLLLGRYSAQTVMLWVPSDNSDKVISPRTVLG
jgi:hypothetical protein